jgi:8-oxo-dGTP pyrophosphatase MutT (NUDIX family)
MNTIGQTIELSPLKNIDLTVTVTDKPITLPPELKKEVDRYWQSVIAERPNLFNGRVYSVIDAQLTSNALIVRMAPSTFAHNVYSEDYDAGEHSYRVFHSVALVVTSDNQIVLGQMGQQTARTGAICFSGGAIDPSDVHEGVVDLAGNTLRELGEELGIDANDPVQVASFAPAYLKTGGPKGKITVIYRLDLAITAQEFQKQYDAFVTGLKNKGDVPEFSRLYILHNTPEEVAAFIAAHTTLDEHVAPVLRDILGISEL